MKKLLTIITVCLLFFHINIMEVVAESYNLEAKEMNVKIHIDKNAIVHTEVILDIEFNQPGQGIYVELPKLYKNVQINDQLLDLYFPIKNFQVYSDDEVKIEENSEGLVAIIGTEGKFIQGEKIYHYAYDMQLTPWSPDTKDFIYLNILGEFWDFPIYDFKFELTFDGQLESPIYLYTHGDENLLHYEQIDKHTVVGSYAGRLNHQAVTLLTEIDAEYLNYPDTDHTRVAKYFPVIIFLLIIIIDRHLGPHKKIVDSVEFHAPNNFSSADVAYIYKLNRPSQNDIMSLIVYWASLGYLDIEEKNKSLYFIKKKDMGSEQSEEELKLYRSLFSKGDVVQDSKLSKNFSMQIIESPRNIKNYLESQMMVKKSLYLPWVLAFVLQLSIALITSLFIYRSTPSGSYAISQGFIMFFNFSLPYFLILINRNFKSNLIKKVWGFVLTGIHVFLLFAIMTLGIKNMSSFEQNLYILYILISVVSAYILTKMPRFTDKGAQWRGQVLGFRRFIQVVEKDRLEALVEENPSYYFDILPFAYVLGLSKVWMKKFEDISISNPSWYRSQQSFSSYYMWSSLNRSIRTMNSSVKSHIPKPSSQTGGGGNFGGGGRFGGGGSAGGGFGGGGGGGW